MEKKCQVMRHTFHLGQVLPSIVVFTSGGAKLHDVKMTQHGLLLTGRTSADLAKCLGAGDLSTRQLISPT